MKRKSAAGKPKAETATTMAGRLYGRAKQGSPQSWTQDAVDQAVDRLRDRPPARMIFLTRAIQTVGQLASSLPDDVVAASLTQTQGVDSLLTALAEAPLTETDALPAESLSHEFIRGVEAKRKLLAAEGGSLSSKEVESILSLSRQQVNNRRDEAKLLAVELGRRGYRYPTWQFDRKRASPLGGLEQTLRALAHADDWSKLIFFLEPNPMLATDEEDDVTPLQALRAGRVDDVVAAAEAWESQGAR